MMFKELNDELARRNDRADHTGDMAAGRVLAQLMEVAACTARLADDRKPGMRPTHASCLVTAALRAQRQTMLNLTIDRNDSDNGEAAGSLFDGCDALCALMSEAGTLLQIIARGSYLPDLAITRLRDAIGDLDAWVVSQAPDDMVWPDKDQADDHLSVSSCEKEGEADEHWCDPCRYGYAGDCKVFGASAAR